MIDKTKQHKKGRISEEEMSPLLQRYTATTVLALLQEVAQFDGVKIDWNELVKNTATGISNAREYQMIWRHLAYRHALLERLEDAAQPLDDDSDLEYELEASPEVSSEASTEAAACVKVLIASGSTSKSHPNNATVEAPLFINIPNSQLFRSTSENSQPAAMRGLNITVPVSVQNLKRKAWSGAEDMELIAAVRKFGEGNWANILRGDYNWERTPSQLSKRWTTICKRQGNLNVGANLSGSQHSDAQRAARHAMSLALDPPVKSTITSSSGGTTINNMPITSVPPTTIAEASPSHHQSQQQSILTKSTSMGLSNSTTKSQLALKKRPARSTLSSDAIRAAAVAAGARIATVERHSKMKAVQGKNAVHIMPMGGSLSKLSAPVTHSEAYPNVHFISTGQAAAPLSTRLAVSSRPGLMKASSPTQCTPSTSSTSNILSQQTNSELPPKQDAKTQQAIGELPPKQDGKTALGIKAAGSNSATLLNISYQQTNIELLPKRDDAETVGGIQASGSENLAKDKVQEDGGCIQGNELREQVHEDKSTLPDQGSSKAAVAESSNPSPKIRATVGDLVDGAGNQAAGRNANNNNASCLAVKGGGNQHGIQEKGDQIMSEKQAADLASMSEKQGLSKSEAGNGMLEGES